jgi:tRNA (cytidine/uridine-2'-O-)-methyltransferase
LIREHASFDDCVDALADHRLFALTTRATGSLFETRFAAGDAFVLGPETRGLPDDVLNRFVPPQRLRIPLRPANRSLNVSNAAAVALYEAWRQLGFEGAAGPSQPQSIVSVPE